MRTLLASILGILLGANGLWMLTGPFHWYAHIPGVTETGPANAHLTRDVGWPFLSRLLHFYGSPSRQCVPGPLFSPEAHSSSCTQPCMCGTPLLAASTLIVFWPQSLRSSYRPY